MSEMVERVARALLDAPLDNDKVEPETVRCMLESCYASQIDYGVSESAKEHVVEIGRIAARAAIEAMREPTEAMLEAGDTAMTRNHDTSEDAWPAMIDAALAGTMIAPGD